MTLLRPSLLPSLLIITYKARCNIVVAPARAPGVSSLVLLVLVLLALEIVVSGVFILVPYMLFSIADVVNQCAVIGTTPTRGDYGTGGAKGEFFAALALKSDMGRMPVVEPAEGNFEGLVVRLGALDNLCHSPAPFYRLSASREGS
jgi:hypothetical protein